MFIPKTVEDENLTAGGAVDPTVRELFAKSKSETWEEDRSASSGMG